MTDVMLALTNAKPGREEAFDAWYDARHIPDVLAADHVLGARRLRAARALTDVPEQPYEFLAIYEVAAGQCAAAVKSILANPPKMSEDVDGHPNAWLFEELGPRTARPDAGDGPFDQMVVFTNAAEGEDEAFNRWYDELHIPDVFNVIGGFVSAQRFKRADVALNAHCPWGYLALYDIPKGQAQHCLDRINWSRAEREEAEAAGREPKVKLSPTLAPERVSWFFLETTPYVTAAATAA